MRNNHSIVRRTALAWLSIPTGGVLLSFRSGVPSARAMTSVPGPRAISRSTLTGTWRNDFETPTGNGSEICVIDKNGHYSINGEHWFDIVNFRYDSDKQTVRFTKAAIKPGDKRQFFNILVAASPDHLVGHYFLGKEGEGIDDGKAKAKYRLEYTRIVTKDGRGLKAKTV